MFNGCLQGHLRSSRPPPLPAEYMCLQIQCECCDSMNIFLLQSGASNRAKIGGAYFSDVTGSIQDPIAVPGPCEVTEF